MAITPEDLDMLKYFHDDKGDMARCSDWPKLREQLKAEHPALIAAYDNLRIAETTLDAVLAHTIDKVERATYN